MAKLLKSRIPVRASIELDLDENEARALLALTKYGTPAFLEYWYKHMGVEILGPYESGLVSLFEEVSKAIPPFVERIDKARKAVAGIE